MNIYVICSIVFATVILLIPFANAESNVTSITYRSSVDQDYGFYRVIDVTTHKQTTYVNNTLTVNVGDTVEWINDATPDEPLTIISKEGLWGNRSAYLRWNFQRFSYTFNESGTYEVYIREYPREQHQIIIVSPTEMPVVVVDSTPVMMSTDIPENTSIPIVTGTVSPKDVSGISNILILILIILVGMTIFMINRNKKLK